MRDDVARLAALPLLAFLLMGMGGRPQAEPALEETKPPQAVVADRPEPELLEFLAAFQTSKGRFVDPMALKALMPQIARGEDDE